jgi:hypothetical protein
MGADREIQKEEKEEMRKRGTGGNVASQAQKKERKQASR